MQWHCGRMPLCPMPQASASMTRENHRPNLSSGMGNTVIPRPTSPSGHWKLEVICHDEGTSKGLLLFRSEETNASAEPIHRNRQHIVQGNRGLMVKTVGLADAYLAAQPLDGRRDWSNGDLGHCLTGHLTGEDDNWSSPVHASQTDLTHDHDPISGCSTDHATRSSKSSADPTSARMAVSRIAASRRISRSTAPAMISARLATRPSDTQRSRKETISSGSRTEICVVMRRIIPDRIPHWDSPAWPGRTSRDRHSTAVSVHATAVPTMR